MPEKQFVISQSKLEEAHKNSNKEWLKTKFDEARRVIDAGGRVDIKQQFAGASMELVAIIDNLEGLEHYIKKYSI